VGPVRQAGGQAVHICVSLRPKTTQASYNNHADNQAEGPAALQNETRVLGVGVRTCAGTLPRCKYTPGLPLPARDARLAQAHILAKRHAATFEGDRWAMREFERARVERSSTIEH
jgi:hypothetical protein